ncbi:MAG: pyridoxal phosphate-dependent decarboxylase family protein [Candidatus Dormibacteria bacterium]
MTLKADGEESRLPLPSRVDQDMSAAQFRRHGYAAIDLAAAYLERVATLPPLALVEPGAVAAALPGEVPSSGETMEEIMADIERLLIPATTHWNHPRFFAYFNSSAAGAGILGELLSATFNVNAMLWRTGPAATELEWVVCRWLARMTGLPDTFDGHINDTASSSTLVALTAAREAAGLEVRELGLAGRPGLPALRVYASEQAHSSVEKAVVTLGLGRTGYRAVACDSDFRMDADALARAIDEDLRAGVRPCAVVGTVGTTATTSIDPIEDIAAICEHHGIWLHVDAAHGGALAILPEQRGIFAGVSRAQSVVINPHKWLFTPLDCSVLLTSRPDVLRRAFSLVPDYLSTPEADREQGFGARNLMDFGVSLGRRMRALKLWMVLRYFGQDGLERLIRNHLEMASWLREQLQSTPGWEMCAPMPMSTLCFRHHPAQLRSEPELEAHNRNLMARVNAAGEVFISHAVLPGGFVLRASIGGLRTEPQDVAVLWDQLRAAAAGADSPA